jgi:hypothetical protein
MALTAARTIGGPNVDALGEAEIDDVLRQAWGLPVPADPADEHALLSRKHISDHEYLIYERYWQHGGRGHRPLSDEKVHAWNLERKRRMLERLRTTPLQRKRYLAKRFIADQARVASPVAGAVVSRGPSLVRL